MSLNRRNRRKNSKGKQKSKSDISRKDKIMGILAIIFVLLLATAAAYYYSLSKGGFIN